MARKIITCTACKARFDVARYPAGSRVRCGRCSQVLTVPDDAEGGPGKTGSSRTSRAAEAFLRGKGPAVTRTRTARANAPARGPGDIAPQPNPNISAPQPPPITSTIGGAKVSDRDPLLGEVIHDQYRIVRKLGEGGYGAVYEANDVSLERRVAVKVMLRSRAANREYVSKFLREARTAAQLAHPNVTTVHGVGFDRKHGVHFLAMEYVEGRTLHDVLQERGPLPLDESIDYIIQCCRGLAAAHERNIIHRDIKPGNLMITPGNAIKVTDFGLAKVYDPDGDQSTVIGTPYFMPPEQFEGKARDGRTDIYALGVTFYYMLTMKRPHTGTGPAQILLSVMTKEPISVCEHRPELPEGIWPIVKRMVHRDPDQRYSDCMDIVHDLEALRGGGGEDAEVVYCPSCGVPNDVDASACEKCGESLLETCPVCNAEDLAGTKFCGDCGANIPEERAVTALISEARALLVEGHLGRAEERLTQARERSPENATLTDLVQELSIRRSEWDVHRDAVRDLLAQGKPREALRRAEVARADFEGSEDLEDLEADVHSALAALDPVAAADMEAVEKAGHLEEEGRIREALVGWRGILVLSPDNVEAREAERRLATRVDRAEALFAEATRVLGSGDPELAVERLLEANTILPNDPLIEGRLEESRRMAAELQSELDEIEARTAGAPTTADVARLMSLHGRYPGSGSVAVALKRAESVGREASQEAVKERQSRALAAARLAEEERRPRDALAAWREACSVDPTDEVVQGLARAERQLAEFDALLAQSRTLMQSGDPEGAIVRAEQALELVANDPGAQAAVARASTSLETMRHEAKHIRTALADEPDDEVLSWAQELASRFSGSALAAEVLDETEQACREAADKETGGRLQKSIARAVKLEQEGNIRAALKGFEHALELAPDNEDAVSGRRRVEARITEAEAKAEEAAACLARGDPEAAHEAAEQSLSLLPDQRRAATTLAEASSARTEIERTGAALREDADPATAQAQLERFQRLMARYPGAPRCVELVYQAERVLGKARQQHDADAVRGAVEAAEEALAGGRLADAEAACEPVLADDPDHAAAKAVLEQVAERRERAAELVANGRQAAAEGRHADALQFFSDAEQVQPGVEGAAEGRAEADALVQAAREQLATALADAERAARERGPREALAAWQAVLELDATHERAAAENTRLFGTLAEADAAAARGRELLAAGDPDAAIAPLRDAHAALGNDDEVAQALADAEAQAKELSQDLEHIRASLADSAGDLGEIAGRAAELARRFPASTLAVGLQQQAERQATQRRHALGVAEVRKLVADKRFAEAVEKAAALRDEGVETPELTAAAEEARHAFEQVQVLRDRLRVAREQGRLEDARETCGQILHSIPNDPETRAVLQELEETIREVSARRDLADTARRKGNLTEAVTLYEELLALNATDAAAAEKMAQLKQELDERHEVLANCESALESGDPKACAASADALLRRYPEDARALEYRDVGMGLGRAIGALLARAERELGEDKHGQAMKTLDMVLRIAPGNQQAVRLRNA